MFMQACTAWLRRRQRAGSNERPCLSSPCRKVQSSPHAAQDACDLEPHLVVLFSPSWKRTEASIRRRLARQRCWPAWAMTPALLLGHRSAPSTPDTTAPSARLTRSRKLRSRRCGAHGAGIPGVALLSDGQVPPCSSLAALPSAPGPCHLCRALLETGLMASTPRAALVLDSRPACPACDTSRPHG